MQVFDLSHVLDFEWDDGNSVKNEVKHLVSNKESEEVFFNKPIFFFADEKHSESEQRILTYGRTNNNRYLIIVFTQRAGRLRIISARDMNRREKEKYEKFKANT